MPLQIEGLEHNEEVSSIDISLFTYKENKAVVSTNKEKGRD